jgi:hypothetical protein
MQLFYENGWTDGRLRIEALRAAQFEILPCETGRGLGGLDRAGEGQPATLSPFE